MVGDPDGDAVGPDAARVAVGVVQGVLGDQFAAGEVVGEERVLAAVEHPHGRAVGPDAARVAVARVELDLALFVAFAALEVVGEEAVLAAVGDPGGLAVGPEAAGGAVALVEFELTLLDAFAGDEVVGVDGVVGAVAVLGEPEQRAVRPGARWGLVAAVERFDVARHVPLELDAARGGAGGPAAAAEALRGHGSDWRVGFHDGHRDIVGAGDRAVAAHGVRQRHRVVVRVLILRSRDRDGLRHVPVRGTEGEALWHHRHIRARVARYLNRYGAAGLRAQRD